MFIFKKLNISNFNTVNVINMSGMFNCCSSLNEINISYFDIKNTTDMVGMFYRCSNEFKKKIRSKFKNINNDAFEKAFH